MFKIIIRALFRSSSPRRSRPSYPRSGPYTPPSRPVAATPYRRPAPRPVEPPKPDLETTLTGKCYVIDGDTIQIGKVRLRLAGIDAPELDHPWGQKAKWELVKLCKGQVITAEIEPRLSYDRVVATCYLPDGRDLGAEMVKRGLALDWPKFSGGRYSHLEPPDARKKHWKAAARQRGHMHVFHK